MGQKLVAYFEKAKAKGGLMAQVKLATITKMSSKSAEASEDSPEKIKLFEEAMKQL